MYFIIAAYFIAGLVVWKVKAENLPLYCIYLTTFGLFFIELANPSYDSRSLLLSSAKCVNVSSVLLLLCTAFNFFKGGNKSSFVADTHKYWIFLFVGGVYFLIWMGLHGRSTGGGISRTFMFASLLPIYYRSITSKISVVGYKKHFAIACAVEAVFVATNLYGMPVYVAQAIEGREFLVAGSFYRYNALASFVGMAGITLSFSFFYKQLKGGYYACLIVPVFVCMLMTGARMQLVWMYVAILMAAFSNFRANERLCLAILAGSVVLFIYLHTFNLRGFSSSDAKSGMERQLYGIVSAVNGNSVEYGKQTQDIGVYMLENYFLRSPVIGNGIGDREYAYHPVISTEVMMGDAPFAFILVEYGVLGFMSAMLIILSSFQIMKKGMSRVDRRKSNVLFASLFVLTLTEGGLFGAELMTYVWTYMAYLKYLRPDAPASLDWKRGGLSMALPGRGPRRTRPNERTTAP